MYKSVLLASILYLSFVYERGYPTARRFNFFLRNRLLLLVELWRKVIERLRVREFEQADIALFNHFLELCEQNPKMMSGYNPLYKKINALKLDGYKGIDDYKTADFESRYREKVLKRVDDVLDELSGILTEKKFFLPKWEIGDMINSLHNLPRAFLFKRKGEREEVMEPEMFAGLDFETVIEYARFFDENLFRD